MYYRILFRDRWENPSSGSLHISGTSFKIKVFTMNKTVVIDIVGLSESVIGAHTPFLNRYKKDHHFSKITPPFPALTTSSQSTYITGRNPTDHGIVGNGWYDRIEAEVKFWKQSDHLVSSSKIWENARSQNPDFTCSKMFWWYNMYSDVEYSATRSEERRVGKVWSSRGAR